MLGWSKPGGADGLLLDRGAGSSRGDMRLCRVDMAAAFKRGRTSFFGLAAGCCLRGEVVTGCSLSRVAASPVASWNASSRPNRVPLVCTASLVVSVSLVGHRKEGLVWQVSSPPELVSKSERQCSCSSATRVHCSLTLNCSIIFGSILLMLNLYRHLQVKKLMLHSSGTQVVNTAAQSKC